MYHLAKMNPLVSWPKHISPTRPLVCNLREFRWQKQLTQKQLAEQLQVSRRTIISIENQQTYPSFLLAIRFADFFETTFDKLFELAEAENTKTGPDEFEKAMYARLTEVHPEIDWEYEWTHHTL